MLWIGSYTHLLYGLNAATLAQEVLHSTHTEQLTAVASSGVFLATGSSDTTIWIFKTSVKKELGALQRHTGTISALAFFKKSLLSASSDGTICVWRVKDWECLLQIKAHKKGVRSMAVHPSGRMALTLGEGSRKGLLWNLMTGKQAVVFKLDRGGDVVLTVDSITGEKAFFPRDFVDMPQVVKWSPSGNFFLIQWAAQVDIFSATGSTKLPEKSFGFNNKVTCAAFVSETTIAVGCDDGSLVWLSLSTSSLLARHSLASRIKDIVADGDKVVCISSGGQVARFAQSEEKALNLVNLDDRLTCLALCVAGGEEAEEDAPEEAVAAAEPAKKHRKTKKTQQTSKQ